MLEHGIVLDSDGPPWPKHDAQIGADTPSDLYFSASVFAWVRGLRTCVCERVPRESGLLKIGGIEISIEKRGVIFSLTHSLWFRRQNTSSDFREPSSHSSGLLRVRLPLCGNGECDGSVRGSIGAAEMFASCENREYEKKSEKVFLSFHVNFISLQLMTLLWAHDFVERPETRPSSSSSML